MDNLGVDLDYLRSQQELSAHLEKELQEINQGGNQLQALREFRASRLSDMEKIEEVTKGMEDRAHHYKERTTRTVDKQSELITRIQVTNQDPISLLETFLLIYNYKISSLWCIDVLQLLNCFKITNISSNLFIVCDNSDFPRS